MGQVLYGYKIEDGRAVIDEKKKAVLRIILERYLGGFGFSRAAQEAGLSISHSQAKRLLTNRKYQGTEFYPQIFTKEELDAVEDEIWKRAVALGRTNRGKKTRIQQKPATAFRMEKKRKTFDDPYKQAEYSYSLIKEVAENG